MFEWNVSYSFFWGPVFFEDEGLVLLRSGLFHREGRGITLGRDVSECTPVCAPALDEPDEEDM